MNEAIINNMIRKSCSWGYKISDESRVKKPFDIFSVHKGKAIYIETKYLPKPASFNMKRLEDHQISSLLKIEQQDSPHLIPLVLIAVNFGRADIRVFYYKDMAEMSRRKYEKESILKKEFENSTNYVTIKKQLIDIDEVLREIK